MTQDMNSSSDATSSSGSGAGASGSAQLPLATSPTLSAGSAGFAGSKQSSAGDFGATLASASQTPLRLLMNNAAFWIAVQCTCSVGLTLFNKKVALEYNHPFIILAIQNLTSIVLFFALNKLDLLPMNAMQLRHMMYMVPTTILFSLMLWTSLEGLRVVSVTLVVIARNFVPLVTGILESLIYDKRLTLDGYQSLILVGIGSILYGLTDRTMSMGGLQWLALNMAFVVTIPLVEKKIMEIVKKEQNPTGITCYRNMISVPILMSINMVRDGASSTVNDSIRMFTDLPASTLFYFFLTCLFGSFIGVAYFYLLKLVTSTTLAITNTAYKLITLAISLMLFPLPFSGIHSWIGIAMSFAGISWYTYLQQIGLLEAKKQTGTGELPLGAAIQADASPTHHTAANVRKALLIGSAILGCLWFIIYFASASPAATGTSPRV